MTVFFRTVGSEQRIKLLLFFEQKLTNREEYVIIYG